MTREEKTQYALILSKIAMEGCLQYLPSTEECGEPDCPDCMPWRPMRNAVKMVNDALKALEEIAIL